MRNLMIVTLLLLALVMFVACKPKPDETPDAPAPELDAGMEPDQEKPGKAAGHDKKAEPPAGDKAKGAEKKAEPEAKKKAAPDAGTAENE